MQVEHLNRRAKEGFPWQSAGRAFGASVYIMPTEHSGLVMAWPELECKLDLHPQIQVSR